jgi:disulfide bond formation protein DsbB
VTQDVVVTLAVLGVIGQLLLLGFAVAAVLALAGVRGPLLVVRETIHGYELWLVFLIAAVATAGSLFLSEQAHFPPCKLCWFQRIFMYPLAVVAPLAALFHDRLAARYLLPLPVIGLGFSIYHLLVERGVIEETEGCQISAPGGCAVKWVNELGYVTIPTMAGTAFALAIVVLALGARRD